MKLNYLLSIGIIACLMLTEATTAYAETERVGDYTWQYFVRDGKAWIGSQQTEVAAIFPKPVGEVTVPSELGGYEVYRIDDYALYNCDEMTSLYIPDTICQVGGHAVEKCIALSVVHLSEGLEYIAGYLFKDCLALNGITIPQSVKHIANYAFSCCSSLSSMHIPSGVKWIQKKSFERSGLSELTLSDGVEIIGEDAFYGCSNLVNVVVPNSVTNIGRYAFSRCSHLESLTLPFIGSERGNISGASESTFGHIFGTSQHDGLTNAVQRSGESRYLPMALKSVKITDETVLAKGAFKECRLLEAVEINDGILAIGEGAFVNCRGLTNILVPQSVTNIETKILLGCNNLKSLTVPFVGSTRGSVDANNSVFGWLFATSAANGENCIQVKQWYKDSQVRTSYIPKALQDVTITDESIISLGAFQNCSNLTSVVIGNSVTNIAKGAFSGCGALESITLPFVGSERGNHDTDDSVFGYVFGDSTYGDGTMTIQHYTGPTDSPTTTNYLPSILKRVEITDETRIGYGAFYQCVNLTNIVINEGVDELGGFSFRYCSRIKEFTIPESVGSINMHAFAMGTSGNLASIFVPLSVTNISMNAFRNCTALSLAYVPRCFKGNLNESVFLNCDPDLQVIYYDENMKFFDETLITEDDSSTSFVAVCTNDCRVSFKWKCSCEPMIKGNPYDYLSFEIDGVRQDFICGETDWQSKSYEVLGDGEHVFRWTYQKDEEGSAGEDCAWVKQVVVAPRVTLSFDGGEATYGVPPAAMSFYADDESAVLPGCGTLSLAKHSFAGWNDGEIVYAAGTACPYQKTAQTLTAMWAANELSAPVITAPETYEADYATVTITADAEATIYYTLDGSEPSADGTGCRLYQGPFEIEGSATIRAIAVRDNYYDSEIASFTVTRPTWTFGEYLNCPERTFTTGGDAEWGRAKGVSADGYALRSGGIGNSQTSRLETVVYGAGTIEFRCKVDGEVVKKIVFDGLAFCIDGVQQGDLMGENAWTDKSFAVTGDGRHTLSWLYVKDEDGSGGGEDRAWLDNVVWTANDALPALDGAATDNDAKAIIGRLLDTSLLDEIDGTAAYTTFRSWVDGKGLSHALVKEAPNAWLSYALDAPGLMTKTRALASEDVVIESIEPSSAAAGAFDLVVNIADAELGEGARLAEALGVEGTAELDCSAFSFEGLSVMFDRTVDGKAKATVTPVGAPPAFFLRVRVK